ncbi:MAG: DUF1549 domain-containing protein [Rhodopirellula sp.]|nr:DUF1549 domain-containing protein [Rhodopirellula sp.]
MNVLCRTSLLASCLLYPAIGGSFQFAQAEDGSIPLHREIDELVGKRLDERSIAPAAVSSDAEFVRRVFLDLTGMVPTSRQARAFLDDTTAEKRQRLIDELQASPDYAIHMARVFDVMLIERRIATIKSYDVPAPEWHAWLTEAFAENRPWDQMVRDILGSDGTDDRNTAGVKFYLVRDVAPHQLTRDVGRLFLGVDLQCAQCHDDPRIEPYRQADYFGIYAFLQRVTSFRDNEKNVSLVGEKAVGAATFVSVFTAMSGETNPRLPGGKMVPDPELEKDNEYVVKPGPKERGVPTYSRRLKLAELLPRTETQGFSRNIANRIWAMLLGRGLVHPLDLHHASNPPSHPELLARLEEWLVEHNYDLKSLVREIMLSDTYQRSSILPDGVETVPDDAFAVAPLRGLSPEQFSWSLLQATGRIEQRFGQVEAKHKTTATTPEDAEPAWKTRTLQLEPLERQTRTLIPVFAGMPGQPDGDFQPIVDQALHLLNSPTMLPLLRDEPGTLLKRLTAISETESLAEELYLSILSRRPSADETAQVRELLESTKTPAERRESLTALIWGLLLSSEFRLNH